MAPMQPNGAIRPDADAASRNIPHPGVTQVAART